MRKKLLLVLCFFVSAMIFAEGQQDAKIEVESSADISGKVEIIVPTGGFYVETFTEYFLPLVADKLPNVEVLISAESSEGTSGTEAIKARIAAGDIPDLYIGPRGAVAANYARENQLVALDSIEGYADIKSRIMPNLIDESLGKLYYFPYEAITTLMIYNKDLFIEAGLDPNKPPETWDDFLSYAEKIFNLPERSWGASVFGATTWTEALNWGSWYWNMLAPVYANFNNGNADLFNDFGTDIIFDKPENNLKEFFAYMKELHKFAPDAMDKRIWNREVAMWPQFGVGWRANLDLGRDKPMVLGEDVAVAPIPVLEEGMTHWTMHGGRGLVMFKTNSEREKVAFEVLKLMFDEGFYLNYCKDLSVLPVIPTVAEDDFFQGPEIKPFVDALDNMVEEESYPAWDDVASIMLTALGQVMITGELTPEEAVEYAAIESRKVLEKY